MRKYKLFSVKSINTNLLCRTALLCLMTVWMTFMLSAVFDKVSTEKENEADKNVSFDNMVVAMKVDLPKENMETGDETAEKSASENAELADYTETANKHSSVGTYIWPCGGYISSYFGYRDIEIGSTYHMGLDIAEYDGAPIRASDGGEVIRAENAGDYGNMVELLHDNGDVTRYAHCKELTVRAGDKVSQGETIAYMGETGLATGVHLHFEIISNGERTDPLEKLEER